MNNPTYEKQIREAWAFLRTHNSSIHDDVLDFMRDAALEKLQALPEPWLGRQGWVWECNECGSQEYSSSLQEADLEYLSCSKCGGNEFHKEAPR